MAKKAHKLRPPLNKQEADALAAMVERVGYLKVVQFVGYLADEGAEQLASLMRKMAHGCTDMSCPICDKE